MKNHPLYKMLKRIALRDEGCTIEQVQGLKFNQAAMLLETREFSLTFLSNMKRGIIAALRERNDKRNLSALKATAKSWLDSNFPHWEAEKGRQSDKPYVTIWLEGKI